jgi:amino acid transporter
MQAQQKIGVATATIIGMNAMIGAGIFSAPAKLLSYVGPAGILTYLFVVLAVWCMALSFARLGQLFPKEGSFYIYAKQWGGHYAGLVSSGSYLIGILIAMGLLLQLAGIYLHDYIPMVSAYVLGLMALALLVIVTMVGGVATRSLQIIALCCTTIPLLLITVMCFSKATTANLVPFAPYGFTNVLRATQALIFGFFGFESVASLFALVENPQRNVPRALSYALLFVSIIYFLFIFSIILAVPSSALTNTGVPLSHVLTQLFPTQTWLITAIHFSITASFLSVLNAMLFATSSLFLSLLKTMHISTTKGSFITPITAPVLMGLFIAGSYSLFQNIDLFFNFTALFVIVAFVTAFITLFTVRQTTAHFIQTIAGLLTAGIILFFALEGIITHLFAGH